jgi:hypothetical protein
VSSVPALNSRHEQNFAGGHVSGVLLQSTADFVQGNYGLKIGLEIASQQSLDLARKMQLSQESSGAQPGVQRESLESSGEAS